jgi:hypothetical protein
MDARQKFMAARKAVIAMEERRAQLVAHTDDEYQRLQEAEEEALEAIEGQPEFYGTCEECDAPIFEGDMAFKYADDNIYLCAEHAPTRADTIHHFQESIISGFLPDWAENAAEVQDHIDRMRANGDLDAKEVWKQ